MVDEQRFLAGRTRSRRWTRVSHGLFVPVDDESGDGRLHALASRLHEDGGFTHVTAARLRGWWLPPLPPGLPEFAAQSDSRNRPRRAELRIIRTTPEPEVTLLRGLPIVPATEVLLTLARHLGLLDVVVVIDSALHLGHVSPDELAAATRARRHGVRRLRSAALLSDGRSESPFETLLRVLHLVCDVGVKPKHEPLARWSPRGSRRPLARRHRDLP
jgi:hypothetical protein